MKYKRSDIILCYPGIGRTFFTSFKDVDKGVLNSSFTYNAEFKEGVGPEGLRSINSFVESTLALRETKNYRYILLPLLPMLNVLLSDSGIPYFVVTPYSDERNEWVKRWLKAGAGAVEVFSRTCNWSTFMKLDTSKGKGVRVYLEKDEWLGNILEQSPATTEEGNE